MFRQVLETASFGVFVLLFFKHPFLIKATGSVCTCAAVLIRVIVLMDRIFFSRTKQFPGECGYGQDPEDHGCSTEPLPWVSVLRMGFIIVSCLGYLLVSGLCNQSQSFAMTRFGCHRSHRRR